MPKTGANAVLKCAPKGDALVDISVYTGGLDTQSLTRTLLLRRTPGRGIKVARGTLRRETYEFSCSVDRNRLTRPLFDKPDAVLMEWEFGPDGEATNDPRYRWDAWAVPTKNIPVEDAKRYDVALVFDGEVTEDTYS